MMRRKNWVNKMEITKEMSITDVVAKYPKLVETFLKFGMHCFGCAMARFENIEQGALAHGVDVELLIKVLNKEIKSEKNDGKTMS